MLFRSPDEEPPEDDDEMPQEMKADLERWRRKAIKALKAGTPAVVFESDHISPELHAKIWAGLTACKSAEDVRAVFDRAIIGGGDNVDLVQELKRANDLLERVYKE